MLRAHAITFWSTPNQLGASLKSLLQLLFSRLRAEQDTINLFERQLQTTCPRRVSSSKLEELSRRLRARKFIMYSTFAGSRTLDLLRVPLNMHVAPAGLLLRPPPTSVHITNFRTKRKVSADVFLFTSLHICQRLNRFFGGKCWIFNETILMLNIE